VHTTAFAQSFDDTPRNILILSSEDSRLPAVRILTDTIESALSARIPTNLSIFTEFLDSSRGIGDAAAQQILPYLAARYQSRKFDLVIALGPQALQLLRDNRQTLFPNAPTMFVAVGKSNPAIENLPADISGVTLQFDLPGTVRLAKALQPGLKRVVVITGASDFDRRWRQIAAADLAEFKDLELVELAGLPIDDVISQVAATPSNTAILYISMFKDGNGKPQVPSEVAARIGGTANAPVYGLYPTYLGKGVVGGYVTSFEAQGQAAAEVAASLLKNAGEGQAQTIVDIEPVPIVDWRVLRSWRLDEDKLPANTEIRFRSPSLWETHWLLFSIVAAALLVQAMTILALMMQARRLRRTEEQLQEANDQLDAAATAADLGFWSWWPAENKVWLASHCRRMLGLPTKSEIDFELFLHHMSGKDAALLRTDLLDAIRRNATFQREFARTDEAGREHWLSATGFCIRRGHRFCLTGTLIDVTDRKHAQIEAQEQREQLIHLTRVSTLGEISGALAHELNQPLGAILLNAQTGMRLAEAAHPDLVELKEILADILEDDRRAGSILEKLRLLARKEQAKYEALSSNQVVDDVLTLVHGDLIERRIEVIRELEPGLLSVRGDRVQVQQVMMNLVRNACDAMAADARSMRRLTIKTERGGNETVVFTVSDSGPGIPKELQDRIFEPFVTTKSKGMGLGLSISRSILVAHDGEIWCSSSPDGGATFGFSLPIFPEQNAWAS
jgi:signal transduction histidine kinase/ABC-type uncharacterized transport system substrate-binding protein